LGTGEGGYFIQGDESKEVIKTMPG
jgi:hypothetical protein